MRPRHGYGFFSVDSSGEFRQKILFFYWDPSKELYRSVLDPSRKQRELEKMRSNMQSFVDSEKILINRKEVRAKVVHVDVGFLASVKRPYIEFLIIFRGSLLKGVNVYENYYEGEVAEYSYKVMWVFPEGTKVTRAVLGIPFQVSDGRILSFAVRKGMETPGYELIEFLIP